MDHICHNHNTKLYIHMARRYLDHQSVTKSLRITILIPTTPIIVHTAFVDGLGTKFQQGEH